MELTLWICAVTVVVFSVLPLFHRDEWWIRSWDFPRLQLFVLGVLVAAAMLLFGLFDPVSLVILALLLAALALQGWRIWPYTPWSEREVVATYNPRREATFTLMVANVLMSNRQYERLLEIVRREQPDVLCTLEPDMGWEQALQALDFPYVVSRPLDNRYGMILQSRLELEDVEIKGLLRDDIPSIHTRLKLANDRAVALHCIHPEPPSPTEADESTERDTELVIVGRHVREREGLPAVVMGDLNDVAWSRTTSMFQKISGMLDPRRGRGMYTTFHAKIPPMRFPLDHVFVTEHFRVVRLDRLDAFGSDHFPFLVTLELDGEARHEHEKPRPDHEAEAMAQRKRAEVSQRESMD